MPLADLMRRPRFKLPRHMLGADLFWWRESDDLHTLVTIHPPAMTMIDVPPGALTFVLFDEIAPALRWTRTLDPRPIVIDSAELARQHASDDLPSEGVLAAIVSLKSRAGGKMQDTYTRLYSLIDWYSDEGELVSLHNDQSIIRRDEPIEFTEIVFRETEDEQTSIVLLNGHEPQAAGSLALEIKNHEGAIRTCIHHDEMPPFTVHELVLDELFPRLAEFCAGEHATLTGTFACRGLFTRPYVMSRTSRLCGYHGGDRYEWESTTRAEYERLGGRGHVNPMAVLNTDEVRTTVNLFNTHGHLEEDCWVAARVYDAAGILVAHRAHWLLAGRHELARGDIADLLPRRDMPLIGHVALNYADDDRTMYPGTVQALMEYRTKHNTARTMAWADEWNSVERQARRGVSLAAYYRVLCDERFRSFLAITNSGVPLDYDRPADYTIRLINVEGQELQSSGTVGPNATVFTSIDELFPDVRAHRSGAAAAAVIVESTADLALMHFTRHERSGVWSAEHFMSLASFDGEGWRYPCGS